MAEAWGRTEIDGVLLRTLMPHVDIRGSFTEIWRDTWTEPINGASFVQANMSRSEAGVLRGLHFHLRQVDLWVLLDGRATVGLVDLRGPLSGLTNSPTPSATMDFVAGQALLIPIGVAHGLWASEPVSMLYLVTNEYDGTDEHGFAWNDGDAGVAWPAGEPVMSERDRIAPSLRDAVAAARQSGQPPAR